MAAAAKKAPKNNKMDEFLKNFPAITVGSTVSAQACKTALDVKVPREAIANIDYKSMLYESAKSTEKWDISCGVRCFHLTPKRCF